MKYFLIIIFLIALASKNVSLETKNSTKLESDENKIGEDTEDIEDCECMRLDSSDRIVGGVEVEAASIPYQVVIFAKGYMCGGTILNKRYILTALHCLFNQHHQIHKEEDVFVVAGEINICDGLNEGGQKLHAEKLIPYSSYEDRFWSDIGLIRLYGDIKFSSKIKPACLPHNRYKDYTGMMAQTSGWGGTKQYFAEEKIDQDTSCVLKATKLKILSSYEDDCRFMARGNTFDKICTFAPGSDSCQGDSGGPLTIKEDGKVIVIGITSYGIGCATHLPGIYTRVSSYLDWIDENIAEANCGNETVHASTSVKDSILNEIVNIYHYLYYWIFD